MNLRRELEELRRRAGVGACPACPRTPIKIVWGRHGEEYEEEEPCRLCGKKPIIIDWRR
jgi:hypothetical protein